MSLLFDSSSTMQVSPSRPLVFSHGAAIAPLQYSREYLLNLQYGPNMLPPNLDFNVHKITRYKTKCGSRGGVRNHLEKYGYRPSLPAITISNVRSIRNKMDELSTLHMHDSYNRRKSLLYFTETCLTERTTYAGLDDYTTIRSDTNVCIRERTITPSYEILTVSFLPHCNSAVLEIKRRRLRWLGHVLRMPGDNIPKVAQRWTPPGKRKRGRPKMTWRQTVMAELREMGLSWGEAQASAKDRTLWRKIVVALCPTGDEEEK